MDQPEWRKQEKRCSTGRRVQFELRGHELCRISDGILGGREFPRGRDWRG